MCPCTLFDCKVVIGKILLNEMELVGVEDNEESGRQCGLPELNHSLHTGIMAGLLVGGDWL